MSGMRLYLVTITLFSVFTSFSQDYHHWSEQFGVRGTLLGGAGTAGLGDNSNVFYNPAAMAWVEDPNLSVTVNAYKIRRTWIDNALGEGLNLKQTSLQTYPNLIAGIVKLDKWPRLAVGYAVITKKSFNANYDFLHQANYEIIDTSPGPENYVASYNFNHGVLEYWAGGGISFQISPRWSIGLSHFGIYKSVDYTNNVDVSALPSDASVGQVSNVSSKINFNYWHVKGNFKPAINFSSNRFRFGMTYTTPAFNVMGRANVYREFAITGLEEENSDVVFVDRREKIKVKTKDLGSLAIGISVKFGTKSWLHFSHETFAAVPYYTLFDPPNPVNQYPNTIPDTTVHKLFGDQNFLAYGEQVKAVTNFGFGYEVRITDRLDMLAGIRIDMNYLHEKSRYYTFRRIQVESSKWDLWHGSVGFGYWTKNNKKWTVGFDYSLTAPFAFRQFANFTTPQESSLLMGAVQGEDTPAAATASQFSLKLVVGIEFGTLKPISGDKKKDKKID